MIRLPVIHNESSHATAIVVVGQELVLEPVRVFNDRWCVRRDGRFVAAEADEFDAFIMPDRVVTDGVSQWKRLGHYLRDRGLFVPGDGTALADAERAGHWGLHRVPVEPRRDPGFDAGLEATLARGAADQRRAA